MDKTIKQEVKRNLQNPSGAFGELIQRYYEAAAGTEREIFIKYFFFENRGFWAVMRALKRHGYYIEKTTFYRIKDDIITDIALRACYEHLICPYRDEMQLK